MKHEEVLLIPTPSEENLAGATAKHVKAIPLSPTAPKITAFQLTLDIVYLALLSLTTGSYF